MKTLIATLLATAAGASFAAAPTAALNHDPATYRNLTQKAESEYRAATAKCDAKSGNDKDVCMAEARLVRTRTEADALSKYNNTAAGRARAHTNVADAEYDLAKARCDAKSGADKDSCMDNAKSVHTAALADAKAERSERTTATGSSGSGTTGASGNTASGGLVTGTDTRDAANAADAANRTANATDNAASKTRMAASDTAITTKVKAGLVKEPNLDSLGIHVETEKGVVMLSGFVNSKEEADKAVKVAKGVDGVTSVKSAIKVK